MRKQCLLLFFMIHRCAERWEKISSEAYHILKKSGCIDKCLISHYDILHTQGEKYLVDDVERYLHERGIDI